MASLIENYNELQFTKKSWEFVSSMENFPFDNLPEVGSGQRGVWTMKDVKESLPKPEKENSLGIFASKAAKELFEKSNLKKASLKSPSGTKGGFTTKDIKKLLPKPEKKKKFFASKVAKELFEKSGDLENIEKILKKNKSTNKKGLYTKAEVEKAILINTIKKEE